MTSTIMTMTMSTIIMKKSAVANMITTTITMITIMTTIMNITMTMNIITIMNMATTMNITVCMISSIW